jgi:hypothetical protein
MLGLANADTPGQIIDRIDADLKLLRAELAKPEPVPDDPEPIAIRFVEGNGVMQQGDRQSVLSDAQIAASDFVVPRDRWKYLEPRRGEYDFSRLDAQIQRAKKAGKKFVLPVMTGSDCTPDWVQGDRVNGVLVPWSSDLAVRYRLLHEKMAAKYASDPLLGEVWITGPTCTSSQEMHTNGFEGSPGYTSNLMMRAWLQSIDTIADLYPETSAVLSISTQKPVTAYLDDVIYYAMQSLGDRAVFQINSLGTQTNLSATHMAKLLELHERGRRIYAEMVGPGHTAALSKLPEASGFILYPGDILKAGGLK